MSQRNDTGMINRVADEPMPLHKTATITATGAKVCDLADRCDGTVVKPALSAGDRVTIKLMNAPGTHKVIADEPFAESATLYTEADGEVQDTAATTANPSFVALEGAGAAGQVVEALPLFHGGDAA